MTTNWTEKWKPPHYCYAASHIPLTKLPVHHRDRSRERMSDTPMCLDMLSCDSIGLRNAAPLMDELSNCLPTLKNEPDLVTSRSLWPCQCPSWSEILTGSKISVKHKLIISLKRKTYILLTVAGKCTTVTTNTVLNFQLKGRVQMMSIDSTCGLFSCFMNACTWFFYKYELNAENESRSN